MNQSNQKQKKINVFCYLTVKDKSTPVELTVKLLFPAQNKYAVFRAYIMIKAKTLL